MPDDSQVTTQVSAKISGRNEPSIEPYRMSASFHPRKQMLFRILPFRKLLVNICSGDDSERYNWSQNQEKDNSWTAFGEQIVDQQIGAASIHVTVAALPWQREFEQKPGYGSKKKTGDGNS